MPLLMSEPAFLALAEAELERIERTVERAASDAGIDIDIDRAGNVLALEFDNGSKIIINSQMPTRELWIAARTGGFHFRHHADHWVDTRTGDDLYAVLSRHVSHQGGVKVTLTAT